MTLRSLISVSTVCTCPVGISFSLSLSLFLSLSLSLSFSLSQDEYNSMVQRVLFMITKRKSLQSKASY